VFLDEKFEIESTQVASDNLELTSSQQQQPTTQASDSFVLDDLSNHYKGELPGYTPNLEKAYETAPDETILEIQQEP